MATLSITIDNTVLQRIVDGICLKYEWQEYIRAKNPTTGNFEIIPNPETKAEFAKRVVKTFITDAAVRSEAQVAGNSAHTAKVAEVKAAFEGKVDITLT